MFCIYVSLVKDNLQWFSKEQIISNQFNIIETVLYYHSVCLISQNELEYMFMVLTAQVSIVQQCG